ncbi:hypothetical protein B0H11DRAFT_2203597 [Mycena galericulata]|nr:hypothetical protein B0H11DRAFT_2203597 [Mycena galericulata]
MHISLRSGLATIAIIGLLSGSVLSTMGWVMAYKLDTISDTEKLALGLQVLVYLLLTIFSTVGLCGTMFQLRSTVQVFVSMLFVELLLGLGSGIFALYLLFQKQSSETIQSCLSGSEEWLKKQLCERSSALKGVFVTMFLVICFIETFGLILGNAYSARLRVAEAEVKMDDPDDDAYWEV